MKKLLILLLIVLFGCTLKSDHYKLSIDDYSVTVGYDKSKFLDIAYDFELPEKLQANETINDVYIYLFDELLGVGSFTNKKNSEISSDEACLSSITVYLNDLPNRVFKINDEPLDESIKTNCEKFNGKYIEKNGYACVIENENTSELNAIELHGDYLNEDQDLLDHITIYIK